MDNANLVLLLRTGIDSKRIVVVDSDRGDGSNQVLEGL